MTGPVAAVRRRLAVGALRVRLRHLPAGPVNGQDAVAAVAESDHVLVLCYGNVCRSPMAERYLRARLRERGIEDIEVSSAGFHETGGRPSPPEAVHAARTYDVDLEDHRSSVVTASLLDRTAVVLLMDVSNHRHLRVGFQTRPPAVFYLRAVGSATDGFEIPDPYGGDLDEFDRVFGEITAALDALVDGAAARRGATG